MTASRAIHTKEAQSIALEHTTPPLQVPDPSSAARNAMAKALECCAQKMGLASADAAIQRLRGGDEVACMYCRHGIAHEIAAAIGALDDHVRSVYTLDYDATPEDMCFGETARTTSLIHLIVWTQRKTAALDALATALDRALVEVYGDVAGASGLATLLDVQVIDDRDVERRSGYGALLASAHHLPMQVWAR